MKILMCFIDMLRGKEKFEENPVEYQRFFHDIGGKYYQNAYTVGTDTFRSFGSILTGKYPIENGCVYPSFVPRKFLLKIENLFSYLLKKDFKIYIKMSPIYSNIALLEKEVIEKCIIFNNIEDLLEKFNQDLSENKMIFYYDEDYHELVSLQNTKRQEKKARKIVIENLEKLKTINNIFDKILIFSDHGCSLLEDKIDDAHSLRDNKTKIVLHLREKKEEHFSLNNLLVSSLDIFPTCLSWFGDEEKYKLDGVKLSDTLERTILMEEGYSNWQGFQFDYNKLKKYYKIRVKSNLIDKVFNYKSCLESNIYHDIFMKKLVFYKQIFLLENIQNNIRGKHRIKVDNLNFKVNENYISKSGKIKKFSSGRDIKNKDYYNSSHIFCKFLNLFKGKYLAFSKILRNKDEK